MEIGLVGLGKMGYPLALNMLEKRHRVFALSRSSVKAAAVSGDNIEGISDPVAFTKMFSARKLIWLMVPAGDPVDRMIDQFIPLLSPGEIIVDGGNSHYHDSLRRSEGLEEHKLVYVDAGISGGPEGARKEACMMIGAPKETFTYLEPLLKDICSRPREQYYSRSVRWLQTGKRCRGKFPD
ncbi:MAG: NAD(P)-binding domain-containing protein [Bacillota bacterium]|nr:NAD(P)-binding domain-containing protein [Bacillota bacterium]